MHIRSSKTILSHFETIIKFMKEILIFFSGAQRASKGGLPPVHLHVHHAEHHHYGNHCHHHGTHVSCCRRIEISSNLCIFHKNDLCKLSQLYYFSFTGFPLTAPLAFTLFSIFSALQFTVGTLPYSLKCITEAKVSFNRY